MQAGQLQSFLFLPRLFGPGWDLLNNANFKSHLPPYALRYQIRGAIQKSLPLRLLEGPVLRPLEGKAAYCLLRPEKPALRQLEGRHLCFMRGAYKKYVNTEQWRERR